jgi:hypothetical protein
MKYLLYKEKNIVTLVVDEWAWALEGSQEFQKDDFK